MTVLAHKRGTWINQYAQPPVGLFDARAKQVDYVVIKYGLGAYEGMAYSLGVPWLAERMGESGASGGSGPANAVLYANQLADQALQSGCIGAVINLEEADGGWHHDDGSATRRLVETFRARAPGVPLFASLDTRGTRPDLPYQRVCAELCDGVMPMVYPGAFGQSAAAAFASALTPLVYTRWAGKDIIPTYQTYSPDVDVLAEVAVLRSLYATGQIQGANTYTLGHATDAQWAISLGFTTTTQVDQSAALRALRAAWVEQWVAIADHGTVQDAAALVANWKKTIGQ